MRGGTFITTVSRIAALAPNSLQAARVVFVATMLRLLGERAATPINLSLKVAGSPTTIYVQEYTDLYVIREVLCDGEYDVELQKPPERILDLGSNIGISVLYFRARYPSAVVHAVEPDRNALRALRQNVQGDSQVIIHEAAVGGADGERVFAESAESWRSSLSDPAADDVGGHRVRVLSLSTLLHEIGWNTVDLLKIDIEGGEWEIFESAKLTVSTGWIVGELHDRNRRTERELRDIFEWFALEVGANGVFHARRQSWEERLEADR